MVTVMVRGYTKKKGYKATKKKVEPFKEYDRILVFDTETTDDQFQNFKIGYFQYYLDGENIHEGLFYEPTALTAEELKNVQKFEEVNKDKNISVYTLNDFIYHIFYKEVYLNKALCLGFNLPFDLSRIALRITEGEQYNKGSFSLILSKNYEVPHIIIDHKGHHLTFIRFANPYSKYPKSKSKRKKNNKGNFLDIETLSCILLDKKRISLKDAGKAFKAKIQKYPPKSFKLVDRGFIDYCKNDVESTYALYEEVMKEYKSYGVNADVCSIYSSAGLGKFALKQMGITPFPLQQSSFDTSLTRKLMEAYYGGRCELQYRKKEIPVDVLDFRSMYPSVFELMGQWNFVKAKEMQTKNVTLETIEFMRTLNLNNLPSKEMWKKFNVLVKLKPNDDFLPVRTCYKKKSSIPNIGLNYLTSEREIYYALPDVIASYLKTSRLPQITEAIEFIAVGEQSKLKKTTLLNIEVDPRKENPIKSFIEERKRVKDKKKTTNDEQQKEFLENKQRNIKIIANSISYGIFVEMNRQKNVESDIVQLFADEIEDLEPEFYEQEGEFFNPMMAVMLTAGARLLLAMAEAFLAQRNEKHYYMDTDSCFVNPLHTEDLQKFFQPLNPYSFDAPFFDVKKRNKLFYGISSKRYILYDYDKIKKVITIIDDPDEPEFKLHGLGHLLDPFATEIVEDEKKEHWHKQIWEDILEFHYGLIDKEDLIEKYQNFFAISSLTISTVGTWEHFKKFNKEKEWKDKLKPFNFFLIGIKAKEGVKPVAPYVKPPQTAVYKPFINYLTGETLEGVNYWGDLRQVIEKYIDHLESKFDGKEEWLERKHLTLTAFQRIGKEVTDLELQILKIVAPQKFISDKEKLQLFKGMSRKEILKRGMPTSTLYYLKKLINDGKESEVDFSSVAFDEFLW